jgi:hypothetical protein
LETLQPVFPIIGKGRIEQKKERYEKITSCGVQPEFSNLGILIATGLLAFTLGAAAGTPPGGTTESWARVNISGPLSEVTLPVYAHLQDAENQEYVLTRATLDALVRSGLSYEVIADVDAATPLYLARSRRPVNRADLPASIHVLYDDGRNLLISAETSADLAELSRLGFQLRRLPDAPMAPAAPKQMLLRAGIAAPSRRMPSWPR